MVHCPKCYTVLSSGFDGRFGLTPREVQCADLVMCGFANCEISSKMAISEWTVKRHLSNIFPKVGVDDRAALTIVGLLGLEGFKQMREGK
jgi:DNA-binding NarL/FixJ family response regulator